jgi:NitT/TauT family transport system substrate-binding protein
VKGWLEAELEAEQYLVDPKNAHEVVRMAKEDLTGFDEAPLWQALYGSYPASVGGSASRLVVPFGFTPTSLELLKRATGFLFEVKSISIPELPADAIVPQFTEEILKEHGLQPPVGEVKASAETISASK